MRLPTSWLDAEWVKGESVEGPTTFIRFVDENKREHIEPSPIKPYFFIERDDLQKASEAIKKWKVEIVKGRFVSVYGKKLVKLECRLPSDVHSNYFGRSSGLRSELEAIVVESYESDIPFVSRLMMDLDIHQCAITSRAYIDIECDARAGFPDPVTAPYRIISMSVVSNDGDEIFICDNDEKKMFRELISLIRKKYHLITGWNLKEFDAKYIVNRGRVIGVPFKFFGIQEIDAMLNYQKIAGWGFTGRGFKLETVAEMHLGIEHTSLKNIMDTKKMWNSFVGDRKALRAYNIEDARIVQLLDDKLHLCDPYIELCKDVPVFLRQSPLLTTVWDHKLLREAAHSEPRIVFPRRKQQEASLLGGYVFTPEAGVYRNALSLDFKSLYPSIMESFMLSPEMLFLFSAWKSSNKPFVEWSSELFGGS